MKTFKSIIFGISVIMILAGFVYLLILKSRGYADNRQCHIYYFDMFKFIL